MVATNDTKVRSRYSNRRRSKSLKHTRQRSGPASGLGRFFRFLRLNANGFSRGGGREANRVSRPDRRYRPLRLRRPEIHPAAGTELRPVPDHADGDAVDVRYRVTAEPKRIAAARLLLFGGIGFRCARKKRKRKRNGQYKAAPSNPGLDRNHRAPQRNDVKLFDNEMSPCFCDCG
jgi:hypothetical protein